MIPRTNDPAPRARALKPGLLDFIVALLFSTILIVVITAVFFRYVLNNSLSWSDEVVRYLFVHLTLLGAALALRDREHIRVEFFVERLPNPVRTVVEMIGLALVVAFNLTVLVVGILWVIESAGAKTPALGLPQNLVFYTALPVGALFAAWFGIRRFRRREFAELDASDVTEREEGAE